jgi:tetratricopeptide (TPR) repeat protein
MTDTKSTLKKQWTRKQAFVLSVVFLLTGIAGGWSIRKFHRPVVAESAKTSGIAAQPEKAANPASPQSDPAQLKSIADAQAAPLLNKLKSDPNNPELLTGIGNLYYDAQRYPIAVDYYSRSLNARPSDASVRTDMGTAYWYMGNADSAIAEFNKALTYAPNNPNTLFNRGLVRWKGKRDAAGAIADWETLLATDPTYDGKDKVEEMLAAVKKQQSSRQ